MNNKGPLPQECPACNVIADWEWGDRDFNDFGTQQSATCPECGAIFMEYSEPVDYERIDKRD